MDVAESRLSKPLFHGNFVSTRGLYKDSKVIKTPDKPSNRLPVHRTASQEKTEINVTENAAEQARATQRETERRAAREGTEKGTGMRAEETDLKKQRKVGGKKKKTKRWLGGDSTSVHVFFFHLFSCIPMVLMNPSSNRTKQTQQSSASGRTTFTR